MSHESVYPTGERVQSEVGTTAPLGAEGFSGLQIYLYNFVG